MSRAETWLEAFLPRPVHYRHADFLRGGVGALTGILLAALVTSAVPGGPESLPYIVAPIGASAVLLFAAPASPLGQPWPLVAGNIVSSLIGVAAGRLFDDPVVAAPVAVGTAIVVMMALRCLHPPGGACALFASVGNEAVREHGFLFALWPVGLNSLLLLAVAVAVNNLTGRQYPHVPDVPAVPEDRVDPPPTERLSVRSEDVQAAMDRLDQGFDVMPGDVVALLRDAETYALHRRLGGLRVDTVMTHDVKTVSLTDNVRSARVLMNTHRVKALPVIDGRRRVVGIVTIADLFELHPSDSTSVKAVMTTDVAVVRADMPVAELVALMTDRGFQHLPVVGDEDQLAGIVGRTELIAVLHGALLGHTAPGT